jgi:hypothetical protein
MGLQLRSINNIPDDHNILPGVKLRVLMALLKLQPMQVQVVGVTGDATVVKNGDVPELLFGAVLHAPVSVKTGVIGCASLLFADSSRVLVRALCCSGERPGSRRLLRWHSSVASPCGQRDRGRRCCGPVACWWCHWW